MLSDEKKTWMSKTLIHYELFGTPEYKERNQRLIDEKQKLDDEANEKKVGSGTVQNVRFLSNFHSLIGNLQSIRNSNPYLNCIQRIIEAKIRPYFEVAQIYTFKRITQISFLKCEAFKTGCRGVTGVSKPRNMKLWVHF